MTKQEKLELIDQMLYNLSADIEMDGFGKVKWDALDKGVTDIRIKLKQIFK